MANTNDTYSIMIYEIVAEKGLEIIEAFADRDINIEIREVADNIRYDHTYTMVISNVHEVTMTPFMIWFLHHVDNGDYYKLVIS